MSRHTSNQSGGSDGTWFLEAVGAMDRTPGPIEEIERLEAENTLVDVPAPREGDAIPIASFDGDPGTSTSSFHPVPAPPVPPDLDHPAPPSTGDAVRAEVEGPLPTREPQPDESLGAPLRSRRNFRWPVVIVLVAAIAAVGAAAFYLPRAVEDEALAVRQSYYDAASDLRSYLPTAQSGLDAITDPASSPDQVSGAVPVLAEFDTVAFTLESVTAEPLPSVLPLVPSGPVDALEPLQVRGNLLGASGSQIATRMGSAYVYRTSIPALLDTGPLPVSATTQEVNEISVRLASSLATDAGIIADLPDDPTFDASRQASSAAVERYAPWQDEYLAALTSEDPETASELVAEIERLRGDLMAVGVDDQLSFRSEADAAIVELAADLEVYLDELTRS